MVCHERALRKRDVVTQKKKIKWSRFGVLIALFGVKKTGMLKIEFDMKN